MNSKALFALLFALPLAGCGMLQALEGSSSGAGGSTTTSAAAASGVASGIDCGQDPNTSATLCLGISICPGLMVNQEVFPMCGFRISGNVVDVECSCGGFLCPLGSYACSDAAMLLAQQNEGTVCAKVSEGICASGIPSMASAGATSGSGAGGGTTSGTCSMDCIASCDNDPVCLQACGC